VLKEDHFHSEPLHLPQLSVPQPHSENLSLPCDSQVLFSPDQIPSTNPHTGIPDIQRWPDTFGYPAISGGSDDVCDYYEQYLRKKYPAWSDEVIQQNIDRAKRIPEVWENIKDMMELEKKIREDNPNWIGGWLG
jgi:hypothetical protein